MKKQKDRVCGNCKYLEKNKYTRTSYMKFYCIPNELLSWWNMRPNCLPGCKYHKFKNE